MGENPYKAPDEDEWVLPDSILKWIRRWPGRPWGYLIGGQLGIIVCGVVATEVWQIKDEDRGHSVILGVAGMLGFAVGSVLGFGLDLLRWRRSQRRHSPSERCSGSRWSWR